MKTAEAPSFWEKIVRLLYPAKCMLCDEILREDTSLYLCGSCRKILPRCGKGFREIPQLPNVTGVLAAFYYERGIDKAIRKMKFSHQPVLSGTLAYLLYDEIMKESSVPEIDFIVPIPMYPGKKRRRGYNQSELVGRHLSRYLDVPLKTDILYKTRNTKPQSRLNREERLRNLDGVFMVKNSPEIEGKIILLVDDVVTTGTTLNTCARILLESGASGVFSTVIAIAEK